MTPIPSDEPYELGGNKYSDQAEPSTLNRGAGTMQLRILIELQVISMLLANALETGDGLQQMRQDVADSIT